MVWVRSQSTSVSSRPQHVHSEPHIVFDILLGSSMAIHRSLMKNYCSDEWVLTTAIKLSLQLLISLGCNNYFIQIINTKSYLKLLVAFTLSMNVYL